MKSAVDEFLNKNPSIAVDRVGLWLVSLLHVCYSRETDTKRRTTRASTKRMNRRSCGVWTPYRLQ